MGAPLESLKSDLSNYSADNSLYTKYNQLNNHHKYTSGWKEAANSGGETALTSSEINNSGFELKFYPTKNGESNALGLVKANFFGHMVEAALEFLEAINKKYLGMPDDYLYDMYLFNALNFMESYCN
ncbi:MAG: hypothetical protein LUD68_09290 [Rikenellaceae bacterium]|nr:hypothetical protein [Rikenellaceae bacterium]